MNDIEADLIEAIHIRNKFVRQNMRKNWIEGGERNTKLIHNLYHARMNSSLIVEIQIGHGETLTDHQDIQSLFPNAFRNRFKAKEVSLDDNLFTCMICVFNIEDNKMIGVIPD